MPATRKHNSGPYVVSWERYNGVRSKQECHTWADACHLMRTLLIEDAKNVQVAFC